MDFGNGRVLQNLSPEAVYGMAMQMKEPENYYKTIEAEKQRKQRKDDQKEMIDYRLARTPKKPSRATVMVDDNGNPMAFDPDSMTMKPMDAGGATFKNGGRVGKGGQVMGGRGVAVPAEIQAIDAYAEKLPPVAGESDGDRWIRAAKTRAQLVGKNDPDAAVRQFDATLRGKLMSDPSIANNPERAAKIDAYVTQQVEDFQKRWTKPQAPGAGVAAPGVEDADDPLGLFKVTPPGAMQ